MVLITIKQAVSVTTYNFSSLLQANEEVFGNLRHVRVSGDTAGLVGGPSRRLTLPVDAALDLAFEVARVLARQQGNLDVAVRVWLQLTLHWLKEELITADQVRLLKFELQLLCRVQVVEDHKAV